MHVRPDLVARDIRGNVETRIGKLEAGDYDAIVLAQAGLERLKLSDRITERLSMEICLPAVGQGALGIECREDDTATLEQVSMLNDASTHSCVLAERALLASLRGGCLAPVAAWGRMEGETLRLTARVLSFDGRTLLAENDSAAPNEAETLGNRVAESLRRHGSDDLIAAARDRS